MRKQLLTIILVLLLIAFFANRFGFYDRYFKKKDTEIDSDSNISKKESLKKNGKILRKYPKKSNPFYKLDQYALNTPQSKSATIQELAIYFSKKGRNDYEKARLAYIWITKNISYDDNAYNTNKYGDLTAQGVLISRKSVCEGFSNLFKSICDSMGLECVKIVGYAKGFGYNKGEIFSNTNHAWNAVKIENEWKLIDVTWGEGHGITKQGKLKSIKEYNQYWFATNPYEFIFTHLPENDNFQFISRPISKEQFEKLTYVNSSIFELGISGKTILEYSLNDKVYEPPIAWTSKYDLTIKETEMNRVINSTSPFLLNSNLLKISV